MHLRWSQTVPAPLRGLILARESETILAWDGQDNLFLFNDTGTIQARRPSPGPVAAAGCAEDGSAYVVAAGETGVSPVGGSMICWLAPDLTPRLLRALPQRATAVAVEPLGRRVAVADAGGTLHLMDARGRKLWRATTPRPLHHLAFVPEKPVLIGVADFGLVLCFGASGECLWRDGLVAHVGSLAVSGDGKSVLLACFSDGLYRYSTDGPEQQRIPLETPCHFAALSYDGERLFTLGRQPCVCLRDSKGGLRVQINLDAPAVAASLGALADYALVGLANGAILRFDERTVSAKDGGDMLT
jgi:WD40 repeat protein